MTEISCFASIYDHIHKDRNFMFLFIKYEKFMKISLFIKIENFMNSIFSH